MYICKTNLSIYIFMSEKASVIVRFPVKSHVYKYLQKKCGEKLVVNKNDFFGSTVLDIFSKNYSDLEAVNDDYLFPVEISMRYMDKMGIYIDQKIIRKFNSRMDNIFREEMKTFVFTNFEFNSFPKEKSLKQFLDFYNISEEDIKLETLVKYYQRTV